MIKNKRIAIIGTVGLPAKYGGWETLSNYIVDKLGAEYDFTVYCSSGKYEKKTKTFGSAELVYIPLSANGVQSIAYDIISMLHAIRNCDGMLILGVSGCIALPFIRQLTNKPLIVNIDGMEWRRDKWSGFAKKFLKLSEKMAVRYASAVVTDNKAIQDYVADSYNVSSSLIAYGGDHANKPPVTLAGDLLSERIPEKDYAFTVCRIEPENNIHVILEAVVRENVPYVIVGNWNNSEYGKNLKIKYSDQGHIYMVDAIYDQSKLDRIRGNSTLYIHGHSAGGTNPSLVEAMWLGLPIIAYDVSYNRETTENYAQYFNDSNELSEKLECLVKNASLMRSIGDGMHEIAARRYCWDIVAGEYKELFESLI